MITALSLQLWPGASMGLYYISPNPLLFSLPRPFQIFCIPLTPHLPSLLSEPSTTSIRPPGYEPIWLPSRHSKSTLPPSAWALDSTLLATQRNCPVILPSTHTHNTKFPSQSIISIIPRTCWHFSHLTKNNCWFQLLPYFSIPFCSKMFKSVIYTHFLHFPPSSVS